MNPSASLAAAIELLDDLLARWGNGESTPAETALKNYARSRRYMGSGDRRAVGDLLFGVFRQFRPLAWRLEAAGLPVDGRGLLLALLTFDGKSASDRFTGEKHAPAALSPTEATAVDAWKDSGLDDAAMPPDIAGNVPEALWPLLAEERGAEETADLAAALMQEAPVDIRVNLSRTRREKLQKTLAAQGIDAAPIPGLDGGLRMIGKPKLLALPEHAQGHFELQDASSQFCIAALDPRPGELVVDYCAGGGGKTVAIADAMAIPVPRAGGGPVGAGSVSSSTGSPLSRGTVHGRILACDIGSARLQSIHPRMQRLGLESMVEYLALNDGRLVDRLTEFTGTADRVLVDAPCSGSGTWRRHPDLRFRTSPERVAELVSIQQDILRDAARLVRPGGVLVYATCSVFACENTGQVRGFLKAHPDFRLVAAEALCDNPDVPPLAVDTMYHCLPHRSRTDGFFFAVLQRRSTAGMASSAP